MTADMTKSILLFFLSLIFLVLFWGIAGYVGRITIQDYHLYNLFEYVNPLAQALFTPAILINRMFIKISMPLAFLIGSPLTETLTVQGLQKFSLKIFSEVNESKKIQILRITRIAFFGLIFALGHNIPDYLNPTAYSKSLLQSGLYPYFIAGIFFAATYEIFRKLWVVALLHSFLNLCTYLGITSYLLNTIIKIF